MTPLKILIWIVFITSIIWTIYFGYFLWFVNGYYLIPFGVYGWLVVLTYKYLKMTKISKT